ncbi:MAG: DUF1211 domain-containing protein [Alphaproteobacteria bacterium]|nr:DUF1211 domain-containing protein [Alphaproteobacteria bacterium]
MGKGRVEAFSDGVIAVIITIMVLEMKPPHGTELSALVPIWPVFVSYVLSFIYVGIYWVNHHHLLHAAHKINGWVMLANMHLLFWLSLFPFMTGWMGENHFATIPVALYGVVLFMAAVAYTILVRVLISLHGNESTLATAIGGDFKGYLSLALYLAGIAVSFVNNYAGFAFYCLVAAIWLIPDRRIERQLKAK